MKDFLKIFGMTAIGAFVAVVLYPAVHEFGHVGMALLVGGKCTQVTFFPVPSVICNVTQVKNKSLIAIGLAGLILPLFLSVILSAKQFWVWYGMILFKGITALSMVVAMVTIVLHLNGILVQDDDITQVLNLWNEGAYWLLAGAAGACLLLCTDILAEHPVERIVKEFEINQNMPSSI